ncbi:MAG: Asp-tRNA(Asn)/Glu-tRNA(Gln) amidotransferase subunit GatC [Caldimicrobium sp.]|nr:Asp-tRNA(Asn)/Glu-tRNA(Gln) amidotransferase subunit GatC [Caldimicrobium sp.]MCX7614112.1 Asp-tRNA(Asn)/Glu-tRNA(Gln) amidotransferase subunit GatC [Caldimicrobium sp.]MDW8183005.1 Asp-tRNA(Asn)/Glu-tRNA(Gln) amidotransferase subunit GatC [Caldimicrobium sp.]
MSITLDEAKKIAHLARLEFEEKELTPLTEELSKILNYFKELQDLDTSEVKATFHPIRKNTPFREDEVKVFENIEGILKNSPSLKDTSIVVPKVVKVP